MPLVVADQFTRLVLDSILTRAPIFGERIRNFSGSVSTGKISQVQNVPIFLQSVPSLRLTVAGPATITSPDVACGRDPNQNLGVIGKAMASLTTSRRPSIAATSGKESNRAISLVPIVNCFTSVSNGGTKKVASRRP